MTKLEPGVFADMIEEAEAKGYKEGYASGVAAEYRRILAIVKRERFHCRPETAAENREAIEREILAGNP